MFAMFFSFRITLPARALWLLHPSSLSSLPFPQVSQGCTPVSFSLFYASHLSLSTTFRSVTRGPWLGEGLLGRAGTPLSLIRSYNGLLPKG